MHIPVSLIEALRLGIPLAHELRNEVVEYLFRFDHL